MSTTKETARYLALIAAAQARIAGMQAENAQRQQLGQTLAYTPEHFFEEADGLEQIATAVISS